MSESKRYDRTEAQSRTLSEAAALLIEAQDKAMAMIHESGLELSPEERNSLGFRCFGELPHPPTPHWCRCRRYRGSGGDDPCRTQFPDHGGVGGDQLVRCGHLKETHAML
ncbi:MULTISPECIES: DUF6422 family protein [unclassified Streptomyces]|uniref:DUF6422 family protein n=1 Tax=unclassified Streptomyces TaxID=2593676 RepID=UPI000AA69D45|nr:MULTISPECIES: DUF6422 family protein [unclassified Streptomyces]AZM58879.1 hypothetical protein DLM49_04250 [Streptomyces sp. WAC 01438]RSM93215.1 hypothetical protein DMA10_22270 [Streptomyces sp. WAC 01420]